MKLGGVRESSNVVDNRGGGGKRGVTAVSGVAIVIALVVSVVTGQDPLALLQGLSGPQSGGGEASTPVDPNDPGAVFTRKILATTEDAWQLALPKMGKAYQAPTLVPPWPSGP